MTCVWVRHPLKDAVKATEPSRERHSWATACSVHGSGSQTPEAHPGTIGLLPIWGTLGPALTCLMDPGRLRGGGRRAQALPDPPLLCGLRHLCPGLRLRHRCLPLLQVGPERERWAGGRGPTAMETCPGDTSLTGMCVWLWEPWELAPGDCICSSDPRCLGNSICQFY